MKSSILGAFVIVLFFPQISSGQQEKTPNTDLLKPVFEFCSSTAESIEGRIAELKAQRREDRKETIEKAAELLPAQSELTRKLRNKLIDNSQIFVGLDRYRDKSEPTIKKIDDSLEAIRKELFSKGIERDPKTLGFEFPNSSNFWSNKDRHKDHHSDPKINALMRKQDYLATIRAKYLEKRQEQRTRELLRTIEEEMPKILSKALGIPENELPEQRSATIEIEHQLGASREAAETVTYRFFPNFPNKSLYHPKTGLRIKEIRFLAYEDRVDLAVSTKIADEFTPSDFITTVVGTNRISGEEKTGMVPKNAKKIDIEGIVIPALSFYSRLQFLGDMELQKLETPETLEFAKFCRDFERVMKSDELPVPESIRQQGDKHVKRVSEAKEEEKEVQSEIPKY